MKILLLSAYDASSHRAWREGLVASFPEYEFIQLCLPPRHFSWRIRGNTLSWVDAINGLDGKFDLIIATSMVDLSTLKGVFKALAAVPTILYFHENQFVFPKTKHAHKSIEPQMVTLYAALSAESLVFNSQFNKASFIEGVKSLLKSFPDHVPVGVVDQLRAKSTVIPVGLNDDVVNQGASFVTPAHESTKSVVWNHRWEHDKGPERLLALLQELPADLDLRFHILGQRFKHCPPEMPLIRELLEGRGWLGQWGPIARRDHYIEQLKQSTFALSTAHHDFQGLSILEAMAVGCIPVVPDRLAYQEYVPDILRYPSFLSPEACNKIEDAKALGAVKAKSTEAKSTEAKSTEAKSTEAKSTEAKSTEAKSTEAKGAADILLRLLDSDGIDKLEQRDAEPITPDALNRIARRFSWQTVQQQYRALIESLSKV